MADLKLVVMAVAALSIAYPAMAQLDIQIGRDRDRSDYRDRDRSLPRGYDERRLEPREVYPEDNSVEFGEYRRGWRHGHDRRDRR